MNNKIMNSAPSLINLESIIKAADLESSLMNEPPIEADHKINTQTQHQSTINLLTDQNISSAQIIKSDPPNLDQSKEMELPKIPPLNTEPSSSLNSTNISSMLNKLATNPDEMSKIMKESMDPNMMEQARKFATSDQGSQIMREMQRKGLDPNVMKARLMDQQQSLRGMSNKDTDSTKIAILITPTRQLNTSYSSFINSIFCLSYYQ